MKYLAFAVAFLVLSGCEDSPKIEKTVQNNGFTINYKDAGKTPDGCQLWYVYPNNYKSAFVATCK